MTNKCVVASCGGLATKKGSLCPTCQLISESAKLRNERADELVKQEKRRTDAENSELSGGDVNYYLLDIKEPKRLAPYMAECEDIIEALEMTFAEGNVLKALWRSCNMRVHGHGKRGQDMNGIYDGDKIAYYGERIKVQRQRKVKSRMDELMTGQLPASVSKPATVTVPVGVLKTFEAAPGQLSGTRVVVDEEGVIKNFKSIPRQ